VRLPRPAAAWREQGKGDPNACMESRDTGRTRGGQPRALSSMYTRTSRIQENPSTINSTALSSTCVVINLYHR